MRKWHILPLLFLLAALTLAACGRRAEETPPEIPPAADAAPKAEVPEAPEEATGGEIPEGAAP